MLSINILNDDAEELRDVLKSFISSMLPHENYDGTLFSQNLKYSTSYVHTEELSMEYYVILRALEEMNKITYSNLEYQPEMTRQNFSDIVEVSAEQLITNPCVRITDFLESEGLNSNLEIETTRELAEQRVYTRSMELYDECYSLKTDSKLIVNSMPTYKAAFISHVGMESIRVQNMIIQSSFRLGKELLTGFDGWRKFVTDMTLSVNKRLADVEQQDSIITVDSLEKIQIMNDELKSAFTPICNWGIPPLDGDGISNGTPIFRHRLDVVVGSTNVGKSMFCKDQAINVIREGMKIDDVTGERKNYRVLYMYGESTAAIVWADLIVNYIYKEYGIYVTPEMVATGCNMNENISKAVEIAKSELYMSGAITLRAAYHYDTIQEELISDYNENPFDMLIIDHTMALVGGRGTNKENIDRLAIALRDFKKVYPVNVLVASHPSSAAKQYLAQDMPIPSDVEVTRESSILNAEADDLFILRDNDVLYKQGLIKLENHKRRGAERLKDPIILRKNFAVSNFIYDAQYQTDITKDSISADEALNQINQIYGDDSNNYIL